MHAKIEQNEEIESKFLDKFWNNHVISNIVVRLKLQETFKFSGMLGDHKPAALHFSIRKLFLFYFFFTNVLVIISSDQFESKTR